MWLEAMDMIIGGPRSPASGWTSSLVVEREPIEGKDGRRFKRKAQY